MAVQKPIRTNIEQSPFTTVPNNVINEIDNMEAFTVWVYLLSKSEDWNVVKKQVKKRFGISDEKIKNIFAYLNAHNLIEYRRQRLPNGRLGCVEIWILNGSKWSKEANKHRLSTTGGKTTPVVGQRVDNSELLKKESLQKEKEQQLNKEDVVVFSDEPDDQKQPADLIATMELVENDDTKAVDDFMREMFRSDSGYNLYEDEVNENGLG